MSFGIKTKNIFLKYNEYQQLKEDPYRTLVFPVTISSEQGEQLKWEDIEPFIDALDIPCEKFVISLQSRDLLRKKATYSISCAVRAKDLVDIHEKLADIIHTNVRTSCAKRMKHDVEKTISSIENGDTYNLSVCTLRKSCNKWLQRHRNKSDIRLRN